MTAPTLVAFLSRPRRLPLLPASRAPPPSHESEKSVGVIVRLEGGIDVLVSQLEAGDDKVGLVEPAMRLLLLYCRLSGRCHHIRECACVMDRVCACASTCVCEAGPAVSVGMRVWLLA